MIHHYQKSSFFKTLKKRCGRSKMNVRMTSAERACIFSARSLASTPWPLGWRLFPKHVEIWIHQQDTWNEFNFLRKHTNTPCGNHKNSNKRITKMSEIPSCPILLCWNLTAWGTSHELRLQSWPEEGLQTFCQCENNNKNNQTTIILST